MGETDSVETILQLRVGLEDLARVVHLTSVSLQIVVAIAQSHLIVDVHKEAVELVLDNGASNADRIYVVLSHVGDKLRDAAHTERVATRITHL